MSYPGIPTHVHNAYRYGDMYGPLSTWWLLDNGGNQVGWIFDDTTPDLGQWISRAQDLAKVQNKIVAVLVAPNDIGHHHTGCVNLYEAYHKCLGLTAREMLRQIASSKRNRYAGYILQKNFDLGGKPTGAQYWIMRHGLAALRPAYGLWDY